MPDLRWHEMTAAEIQTEYDKVADELERVRRLIDRINREIHHTEPVNPWWHDRVVAQQTKQWPRLWSAIRSACTEYRENVNASNS